MPLSLAHASQPRASRARHSRLGVRLNSFQVGRAETVAAAAAITPCPPPPPPYGSFPQVAKYGQRSGLGWLANRAFQKAQFENCCHQVEFKSASAVTAHGRAPLRFSPRRRRGLISCSASVGKFADPLRQRGPWASAEAVGS
jgi:hypothetical protein